MGAEARVLGHVASRWHQGGARAARVNPVTVSKGAAELEPGSDPLKRVRQPGGGRKPQTFKDPELVDAVLAPVAPDERWDPMSRLRWTTKTTWTPAEEPTKSSHPMSASTVANLLHDQGFSLQDNSKQVEGTVHEDRDTQFKYLNAQSKDHIEAGQPVISVDPKKKAIVGQFKTGGRRWRPAGDPNRVSVHDFPDPKWGKANPYGVYDVNAHTGGVSDRRCRNQRGTAPQARAERRCRCDFRPIRMRWNRVAT